MKVYGGKIVGEARTKRRPQDEDEEETEKEGE
jgi:hypothetical protein